MGVVIPRIFLESTGISSHIPPSKLALFLQFGDICAATTSVNRVFSKPINSEKQIMYKEIGFPYKGYGTGMLPASVPAVNYRRGQILINPESRAPSCLPGRAVSCQTNAHHGRQRGWMVPDTFGVPEQQHGAMQGTQPSSRCGTGAVARAVMEAAGCVQGGTALTLMWFVVIGNWTAKKPGSCFYGNVLEQRTREQKNRRRVPGSCQAGCALEGL